jgi:hypothetical protein
VSPSPQDAYPPAQVAHLVEQVGVKKATLPAVPTLALGLLAGAFIAFGAMFSTLVLTDNPLGFGPGRLLGGLAFSLGLVLVVVGGMAAIGVRLPFGRLPGDIAIEGERGGIYIPIVSMILISVVLTVLVNLFLRR